MRGRENRVGRSGPAWARSLYLGLLGALLGLALVVDLTDDLGRRVCGGAGGHVPGATVLLGCAR